MDHSHHDHAGMGHAGMDMGGDEPMCSMNMLFTWDTTNLCIVFPSWRVRGTWSLIVSLLGVMALTAGYEAVRELSRRYENRLSEKLQNMPRANDRDQTERSSLLWRAGHSIGGEEQRGKFVKAVLYGFQVFYSFFIMLLFMTYNGWIMIAVGVGATIGYFLFGGSSASKSAACH